MVEILLATFHGERFLREQIDSILSQSYRPLRILARDDGSSDGTAAILEEYAKQHPDRFRLLAAGVPTGSAKSNFAALLEASQAEYIAFADQDDVWLPGKIELQMQAMGALERKHDATTPLMVFTDLQVVDENLRLINASFWKHQEIRAEDIHHFPRVLVQNPVTGCACLLNRAMAEVALPIPEAASMHDWWIALLASACGTAGIVQQTTVLYRQHGGNVIGAIAEGRAGRSLKLRHHSDRDAAWRALVRQAEALLSIHGQSIPADKLRSVQQLLRCDRAPGRFSRIVAFLSGGFFFSTLRKNLVTLFYLWDRDAARR